MRMHNIIIYNNVYLCVCVRTIETAAGVAVCRLLEYCFIVGHDTLLATQSEQNYVSHRSPTQPVVMLRFSLIISDICLAGGPLVAVYSLIHI